MADSPFVVRDVHNPHVGLAALPSDGSELNIVLFSDIHMNMRDVSRASAELVKRGIRVDVIACPGDIAAMKDEDQDVLEKVAEAEGSVSNVMLLLEYIQCRCFFVPGNHDPGTLFDKHPPSTSPYAVNAHCCSFRLAPGLIVAGVGGSLTAVRNGAEHWQGYPYKSDEARFAADLEAALQSAAGMREPGDQILLLTHVGPHDCATTVDRSDLDGGAVYAGARGVRDFLEKHGADVVANVHGHTHEAHGRTEVHGVPVVNPGALLDGRYGVLTLARGDGGRWAVSCVQFFRVGEEDLFSLPPPAASAAAVPPGLAGSAATRDSE